MAFKFFNIAKANQEIERLEGENTALKGKVSQLEASAGENIHIISLDAEKTAEEFATVSKTLSQSQADLKTAQASIASQAAEIEGLKTKLAGKDEEVKITVARQVANTQAALGQPPAPAIPPTATATSGAPKTGMARVLAACKEDLDKSGYVRKQQP